MRKPGGGREGTDGKKTKRLGVGTLTLLFGLAHTLERNGGSGSCTPLDNRGSCNVIGNNMMQAWIGHIDGTLNLS